jgi:NDP-sugar pyrophosphorylase family protein
MSQLLIRQALIMAAGRGNRMRPLTDTLPKSMAPYKGDTLIGNSLTGLKRCIDKIHVTVGYKKAMLSEYLMARGVDTIINTEGHGNAWWVTQSVMRFVDEPVLVLTTDNVTEIDLKFLTSEYIRLGEPVCMLVPVKPIPGVYGDYVEDEEGLVLNLQRVIPKEKYCSGIQILNPSKLKDMIGFAEDFNTIWSSLIAEKLLFTSTIYPQVWFSVDTLEQLASLNQDLRKTNFDE